LARPPAGVRLIEARLAQLDAAGAADAAALRRLEARVSLLVEAAGKPAANGAPAPPAEAEPLQAEQPSVAAQPLDALPDQPRPATPRPETPGAAPSVPPFAPPPAPPPSPPVPTGPSFEERLGTRWVLWVGGVALALGGVFLVRYSIERGLLGPAVRVFLGGVLGLAHVSLLRL
jgi:uncharacterized membrane protein